MKKYILLTSLLLVSILSLTDCKKDDEITTEETHNYAKNEVDDSTTEEINDNDNSNINTTETISENTTTEEWIPSKNTYNVTDDVNANENLSFDTISIDGKMISFPCSYEHLKDVFGKFYITMNDKSFEINEDDFKEVTNLQIEAIPTTGEGKIQFNLVSLTNEPISIKDMTCNKICLSGINTENKKLMTIALADNIHFGSTVEDIFNSKYGKVYNKYDNNDTGYFYIEYKPDGTKNSYYFFGENHGLQQVIFEYLGDKDPSEIVTNEDIEED